MSLQSASSVILIRPTGFGYDPETAASNAFQQQLEGAEVNRRAADDFNALLDALRHSGIRTTVLDPIDPTAPNGVFPNNWFSTHANGAVVMYPMLTPSRRRERDPDLAANLMREGFDLAEVFNLGSWEANGRILEGTGSLVLDRLNQRAYACLSPRTTVEAVQDWCELMHYTPITFTATMDGTLTGQPVYHTNVVMSIGTRWAMVCLEAVPYPGERAELVQELESTGRQVIPITLEQMHRYVGNALELRAHRPLARSSSPGQLTADNCLFLSQTAFEALQPDQRMALERHMQLVPVPVPTIESVGGGSLRCMIAENFLPHA